MVVAVKGRKFRRLEPRSRGNMKLKFEKKKHTILLSRGRKNRGGMESKLSEAHGFLVEKKAVEILNRHMSRPKIYQHA